MTKNVEDARQAFIDALEEAGVDRDTADAQTKYILPSTPTVVGNYADLQRMGAAVLTGTIPTPPFMDDVDSSDIKDAITMPPDPDVRETLGTTGGDASVTIAGDPPDRPKRASSTTKKAAS